jgi:hypothetical protein
MVMIERLRYLLLLRLLFRKRSLVILYLSINYPVSYLKIK